MSRDPAKFCEWLYRRTTQLGLRTLLAEPLGRNSTSVVARLAEKGSIVSLRFTSLVLCAGPWTGPLLSTLSLPSLPLSNLPGHSILVRPALESIPANEMTPEGSMNPRAVFAGLGGAEGGVHASTGGIARVLGQRERKGYTASPEVFPRVCGKVFIAGENSIPSLRHSSSSSAVGMSKASKLGTERFAQEEERENLLPRTAREVMDLLDEELIQRLVRAAALISPALDVENGAKVEVKQVRPLSLSFMSSLLCWLKGNWSRY